MPCMTREDLDYIRLILMERNCTISESALILLNEDLFRQVRLPRNAIRYLALSLVARDSIRSRRIASTLDTSAEYSTIRITKDGAAPVDRQPAKARVRRIEKVA